MTDRGLNVDREMFRRGVLKDWGIVDLLPTVAYLEILLASHANSLNDGR